MSSTNLEELAKQKKYRILMVTGIYPTKERPHSGTFVKALVDALEFEGHTVEIVHPKPGPVPIRYASATLQVFLKTLTGRFDIIHGHYGLWCLVGRLQWTTAVVAAFLGDDLLGTVTAEGGHSKKSLLVKRVSQWLCHHVEAVTVKTEQMKRASLIDDAIVIPDGINFELFQPIPREEARAALGWDQDRYYVVFANNPAIPVKNFALAQAAIERLKARGMTAELVVANGLPQSTVVQYMNASNALILPSVAEGSPNVVREAMACNVPVVTTDVGDVAQVLAHTEGCSTCPHDAEALAAGLEKALLHTERTTGRQDTAHLDGKVLVKQVIAMYEMAIEKKHHRAKGQSVSKGVRYGSSS
ncbi:glycosyltransferase [Ktedonosporobacter rubrisoli]|uniref:glycosyltransferase n=1 Tax=Ktedonosporobacter rubrisoli TaxID=2509675 RepID=UPI0013EE5F12|nr:glycosyltransferase [Ktedonosporobacter rubrisoli]